MPPLPVDFDTVRVHGHYIDLAGTPLSGTVSFNVTAPFLVDAADLIVIMRRQLTATLDENGEFILYLPATDDPDITPTGFTYTVTEQFANGVDGRTYSINVPLASRPNGVEIALVVPAVSQPGVVRAQLLSELSDVEAAAPLEGDIVVRQGTKWVAEDPAERLYDKEYGWELQPGSDVMATTLGVLPKVGDNGAFDYYMGLVTVAAGAPAVPAADPDTGAQWYLDPVGTAASVAGDNGAVTTYVAGQVPAPGAYMAVHLKAIDDPPPYAFPAGWTPGNTTGAGPVLPLIGHSGPDQSVDAPGRYDYYAGLVQVSEPIVLPDTGYSWWLVPATTPLTPAALGGDPGALFDGDSVVPGLYLGVYTNGDPDANVPPTALPAGWTFRPYGIGPVAITDENGAGLIGDIAYVVSGYVYNMPDVKLKMLGVVPVPYPATGSTAVEVGDVFVAPNQHVFRVTGAGTIGTPETATFVEAVVPEPDYAWPFLERYDLAAKKWLSRIPLPPVDQSIFYLAWAPADYDVGHRVLYGGLVYIRTTSGTSTLPPPDETGWEVEVDHYMPYAAEGCFAGVIDGKLYFGGGDGGFTYSTQFFVFDPATGAFTKLPDIDTSYVYPDYSGYAFVEGRVWLFDGGDRALVYDPALNTWTQRTLTLPASGYGPTIYTGQGCAVIGNKVYSIERNVAPGRSVVLDTSTLVVTSLPDPVHDTNISSSFQYAVDGKVYRVRGSVSSQGIDVFDPATSQWSDRPDVMNDIRTEYVAGVVHDGLPVLLSGRYEVPLNLPGVQSLDQIGYLDSPAALLAAMKDSTHFDLEQEIPYAQNDAGSTIPAQAAPTYAQRGFLLSHVESYSPLGAADNVEIAPTGDGLRCKRGGLYVFQGYAGLSAPVPGGQYAVGYVGVRHADQPWSEHQALGGDVPEQAGATSLEVRPTVVRLLEGDVWNFLAVSSAVQSVSYAYLYFRRVAN